ncbi:MAG: MoxR family ATPase [Saprospiraceae bacterium]|nr:MoxR family ATPase [Bacteroidia bacterium]NNE13545.1 MoxR family ATPase [Saprospiraceae bacterium]NNL93079.1 MoxR family ATPase [Saprospiraceae bacterium]
MEDMNEHIEEGGPIIPNYTAHDIMPIRDKIKEIIDECSKVVIGQRSLVELMVTCILSEGHILLEGVPGVAKTLTAKVLAKTINSGFSRIQFTPDLMPADIIGTSIFNMKESEFVFKKGPIFSNVILIDEINRAPAKTQSALFEVMEEKQISFDGVTYQMEHPFIVIATQNPIEHEGTYRLPEAQLDRFLMKINLGYLNANQEVEILKRFKNKIGKTDLSMITPKIDGQFIKESKRILEVLHVEDQILNYIVKIVQETREHGKIYLGASPRASLGILNASKVTAVIAGRDFITPEDIQFVAPHVLNHRLILTPDAEMEGMNSVDIINDILKVIEVPR